MHLLQIRERPHEMRRALIPARVLPQILLMIILRIPPGPSLQHLRRHLPLPPLLPNFLCDLLRNTFLLFIMPEDPAPILRPRISALPVQGRGIVHLIEELQQRRIADFIRIEDNLTCFCMACATGADGPVGRGGGVPADIPNFGVEEALAREVAAVEVLDAPEAAGGYGAALSVWWEIFGE